MDSDNERAGTRVYRYGLMPPDENAALARDQMRRAHAYRNTLAAAERGRRAAIREPVDADSAVVTAVAAVQALPPDASKKAKSAAYKNVSAARRAALALPTVVAYVDAVNERYAEFVRVARGECGVYWGTYLLIEAEHQAARALPMWDGLSRNDPRFQRWDGSGRLGVQLQKGLDAAALCGDDTRVRVVPVDARAWSSPVRGERRRLAHTRLQLRVGSDGRAPIWAGWEMVMHRPLPAGAKIKWVQVHCQRVGPREQWWCTVTVDVSSVVPADAPHGAVAVDLGWRQVSGGIRVGYWRDAAGASGEVAIDDATLEDLRRPDELRATRDAGFNVARATLCAALAAVEMPPWLRAATRTITQWRSPARLAGLARRWRGQRFDGDAIAFGALEAWRYHDHHLWAWQSSLRQQGLARRREAYRVAAAALARTHSTLVLEDLDLRPLVRLDQAGLDLHETARGNRHTISPSELRSVLQNAFVSRGRRIVLVPPQYTTRTCGACGGVTGVGAELVHTCDRCGATWDRDANAAANILARERSGALKHAGTARDTKKENNHDTIQESRWTRARRLAAEKESRKSIARNVDSDAAE